MTIIREKRIELDMPQSELAYLAGISAKTVSNLETGKKIAYQSYLNVCIQLKLDPKDPAVLKGVMFRKRVRG